MELDELLRHLVCALQDLDIPYALTGSIASMAYGEPRTTLDIDALADVSEEDLPGLQQRFPEPDFFLDEVAARRLIADRQQFQILSPASGFKIDVYIPRSALDWSQIRESRLIEVTTDLEARLSPPEHVIVNKLIFYREGHSSKHPRDIASMLRISGDSIDRAVIEGWVERLGLEDTWATILERVEDA
ncbi:MAG: hypothetical protein ACRD3V_26065 [Vicinamibacteria bacterium]